MSARIAPFAMAYTPPGTPRRIDEAALYLSTFKQYENKPPDTIKERVDKDYASVLRSALTSIKGINKTDVETLRSNCGVSPPPRTTTRLTHPPRASPSPEFPTPPRRRSSTFPASPRPRSDGSETRSTSPSIAVPTPPFRPPRLRAPRGRHRTRAASSERAQRPPPETHAPLAAQWRRPRAMPRPPTPSPVLAPLGPRPRYGTLSLI